MGKYLVHMSNLASDSSSDIPTHSDIVNLGFDSLEEAKSCIEKNKSKYHNIKVEDTETNTTVIEYLDGTEQQLSD
jgi:hypothetical protein